MLNMGTDHSKQRALRFGWVSLFQDLGSKMVVPILPLFLALSIGASPFLIGLIDGVGAATAALVSPLAARMTHRFRPILLVRVGYGLSSIAKLGLVAASSWGLVLGVRFGDRVGKGIRDAPRDLLLAGGETAKHGRSFGIQQAMDKFGGFVGPLIGIVLYEARDESFSAVFAVAFIPCAISVALLFRLPGAIAVGSVRALSVANADRPEKAQVRRMPGQVRALVALGLHGFFSVSIALLLVRASVMGVAVSGILGAYALLRLTTALGSYPAGTLCDRIGAGCVVAIGMALSALGLGVVTLGSSASLVWLSLGIIGLSEAFLKGPSKVWLLSLGPTEVRARVLGDLSAIRGIAGLAGALLVGAFWSSDGSAPIALFAGGCAVSAVLCAGLVMHPTTNRKPQSAI